MPDMRMEVIGGWLAEETGEEWDSQRVRDDYLLPIAEKVTEGCPALTAKDAICDELGIEPGRRSANMWHLEREISAAGGSLDD